MMEGDLTMADQPPDDKSQTRSRYQRVREILNEAQGDARPSYQGHGRFWELPLEEFLAVTIYGVRMIAPAGEEDFCQDVMAESPSSRSCCESTSEDDAGSSSASSGQETGGSDEAAAPEHPCCGPADSAGAPHTAKRSRGRGAASGLIKGLKGEFPFDGTQFPRLPWGGKQVSGSDILFIEGWIDDGCPATDETNRAGIEVSQPLKMALAQGHEEHPISPRSVNEFSFDAGKIKVRKNIECLTPDELERFRRAIRVMRCYDDYQRYDPRSFMFWADIHANNCQHGWEQFLTWHRMYLYYFEQQLQDIDPTVMLPYWDWTLYRENVLKSIEDMKAKTGSVDNGIIPKAYRCWVDEKMLNNLKGKIPDDYWMKLQSVENQTFDSGNRLYLAAGITYGEKIWDDQIMAELQRVNPLWDRNRWPGGNYDLIFEAYPTPEDVERILQIQSFFTFGSGPGSNHFFGAVENIHNLIHNFSGGVNPNAQLPGEPATGDMVSAGTTARDPIFWGHHSNVDRLWAEWQRLHPGADPDDPNDVLAPWPNSVKDVLTISDLGYEYMKSAYLFETDNTIPIARFKSARTGVHPAVLARHSRAEIRLHKVQYSTAGGAFIRVFLNEPDANAETPMRGNDHFVAQVATFSGECIGGPGHCDVPPESRRKYDLRPRHRKTPGNFRIDATEAVRKLSEQGETDFQINLVVLDVDGTPKPNALWMDAVSLNFKD
jgi:tyrosinase